MVFYVWAGLFVPHAVPADVVTRLRQAVGAVMNDPQTIGIFKNAGSPPAYMDATEFAAYIETGQQTADREPCKKSENWTEGHAAHATHH